jgi:RNA polymerase sigma-70 factor (ECF subfamily)
MGKFQLEAAIQSVHAERRRSGRTDWAAITLFYEQLMRISPVLGTQVGYAAALAEASAPERGLAILDAIKVDAIFEELAQNGRGVGRATQRSKRVSLALGGAHPRPLRSRYQPYWAVRAHLLQRLGRISEASAAYDRAIGLAEDPTVRKFLLKKREQFSSAM